MLRACVVVGAVLVLGAAGLGQWRGTPSNDFEFPNFPPRTEFHFVRVEYRDLAGGSSRGFGRGFGRGWWMQDWPRAELHFTEGVQRLSRIDIGQPQHAPLTDDRIFEYPWAYVTQAGFWDLSDTETARLREYLLRGGFLVVDDFWGPAEWAVFQEVMSRTLPGRPIVEISPDDALMHTLYDIDGIVQVPGLRHLRRGPENAIYPDTGGLPPHWRAIYDERGRMLVVINFNMDIGDAWEEADVPEYPLEATALAYRFAINCIIYSMTH